MRKVILLALLCLAFLPGDTFADQVDEGQLMAAFTLRNGASVTVAYQEQGANRFLNVVYLDLDRELLENRFWLPPGEGLPERLVVDMCGRYLQIFVNEAVEDIATMGTVERYTFELPVDSGRCAAGEVFLPLARNAP